MSFSASSDIIMWYVMSLMYDILIYCYVTCRCFMWNVVSV